MGANATYFALLLLGVLGGHLLTLPSLANTAITFLCLWLSQILLENCGRGLGFYVVAFALSALLWHVALWLRGHPEFLGGMLGLSDA